VTTTSAGPTPTRVRRIFATGLSSGLARLASLAVTLVAVPLVIRKLGAEQYGVYVSLAALVNILLAVDLGLGSALVNEIADLTDPDGSRDRVASLVSSAVLPLCVLVVVAGGLLVAFTQIVDISSLLNTPSSMSDTEVTRLLLLAFIPYLLSLPLGIVVRIRYGLQEGHVSHLCQVVGYGLQLALLLVAAVLGAGLAWFVVLLGVGALLGYLIDGAVMLVRRPWVLPRPTCFVWPDARRLLGAGGLFLVLGISAAVGYQTDAVVIAHWLGPDGAATYGATFQVIVICPLALSLFLNALWPAYREALASGDTAWVRRTFVQSLRATLPLAAIASVALVALGPWLVELWAGPSVRPPLALVAAGAVFVLVNAVSGPVAMLLNGMHQLRPQALAAVVMAVANIALSIVWVQSLGLSGPLLATAVTQLVCILVPMSLYLRHLFRVVLRPPVLT
jgi:O-antigen/teichoic acid export membrane protein